MIWYYLAGFISGAVGVVMLSHWLVRRLNIESEEQEGQEGQKDRTGSGSAVDSADRNNGHSGSGKG